MPYALTIPLRRARTLPTPGGTPPRALHALFYHWLEAAEPRLARFVHEQAEPKPFTVSPLLDDDDEHAHFRVTLMEDEYWPYVAEGIKRERTVRIGQHIWTLEPNGVQVEQRAYADIVESASADREVTLQFESPTSFHVNGLHEPLPIPRRVYQSFLLRWNAFSGLALEPSETFLEWVTNCVAVSRFELHSETVRFGAHQQIGCIGTVSYVVAKPTGGDHELVRWLNRLADYAYFCGTGHKTTQGMGQTRRSSSRAAA